MGRERSEHVVVCGSRGVAQRTVEQLRAAGADVVVVDVGAGIKEALLDAGVDRATAVVCLQDDELAAMEAALLVRQLRPEVRLVVRMGNGAVARALAEVIGEGIVLDVAALAAPSVVEVCLGRPAQVFELAGQEFVVAELAAGRDATLRALYGELAPLAVRGGPAPVVCPGRDWEVGAGERVTVVGTPAQFAENGAAEVIERMRSTATRHTVGARNAGAARAARRDEEGGRIGLPTLLRSLLAEADRPLRTAVGLLAGLVLVSVVVLRLGYVKDDGASMSLVDAVYFTVETIATVGYGDFSFAEQATWLRVFAIGLMGFGAVLAAVVFALVTQLLVSQRLEQSFGYRRVGAMRGHVVVVGLGAVGVEVVESLRREGRRVVAVDRDEDGRYLARVRALGVPVVIGDATDTAVLATANLAAATAVAVLTSNDLTNIETGLVVRDQLGDRWGAVPVALRVFDRELAGTVEDGFGFAHVRSTDALAAPWFVGAALGLHVLATFYVDRIPFLVGRIAVATGGGLDGLAMGELAARTRVVAIRRSGGGLEYPPRRGTRFGAGDDAYLLGPYEELLLVLRRDGVPGPLPFAE